MKYRPLLLTLLAAALACVSCKQKFVGDPSRYELDEKLYIPLFPMAATDDIFTVRGGLALSDTAGVLSFVDEMKDKELFRLSDACPGYYVLTGTMTETFANRYDRYFSDEPKRGLWIYQYKPDEDYYYRWQAVNFISETLYETGVVEDSTMWWRSLLTSDPYYIYELVSISMDGGKPELRARDSELSPEFIKGLPALASPLNLANFDAARAPKTKAPRSYGWDSENLDPWSDIYVFGRVNGDFGTGAGGKLTGLLYTRTAFGDEPEKNCDLWIALFGENGNCTFSNSHYVYTDEDERYSPCLRTKFKVRSLHYADIPRYPLGEYEENYEYESGYSGHTTGSLITRSASGKPMFQWFDVLKKDSLSVGEIYSVRGEINYGKGQSWTYVKDYTNNEAKANNAEAWQERIQTFIYRNDALTRDYAEGLLETLSENLDYLQPLALIQWADGDNYLCFAHWQYIDGNYGLRLYVVDDEYKVRYYRSVLEPEGDHEDSSDPFYRRVRFSSDDFNEAGFNTDYPEARMALNVPFKLRIGDETVEIHQAQSQFNVEF